MPLGLVPFQSDFTVALALHESIVYDGGAGEVMVSMVTTSGSVEDSGIVDVCGSGYGRVPDGVEPGCELTNGGEF